jgi:hypothetical protein
MRRHASAAKSGRDQPWAMARRHLVGPNYRRSPPHKFEVKLGSVLSMTYVTMSQQTVSSQLQLFG